MRAMRQRLLLVAGWATAAVVASLVSTGAVAVAGGKVTDRPLRPLSASEVAALTTECESTNRVPCLRQTDDSSDPPLVVVASPSNSSPQGDEGGVSPEPDAAGTSSEETPDTEQDLLSPDDSAGSQQPAPSAEVVDLTGGKVSVSGADGAVRILWLFPRHGYALLPADRAATEPGQVTVVLSDGSHQSTLIASWDESKGLVIETYEGALATDEG